MADYTIDTALYNTALDELRAQWRRKSPNVSEALIEQAAERTFSHAWHLATQHHHHNAPKQVEMELPAYASRATSSERAAAMNARMEEMRKTMSEAQSKTFELIESNHRTGLIKLFTTDNGVSQATAEQIVDNHILTQ